MKYGVAIFPADFAIRPDQVALAAEQRGFESIFFPEHTHIPTSRRSPYPRGGDLPAEYSHTLDPFVAMTMAAAVTKQIKLATGICLVIERDPIVLAKEVASVDLASGGRVIFGIGGGWNSEEMENHGTVFKSRWKLLRERIEAMKAIWSGEQASYHGELVNFDPIWCWPKPVQKPHPPILLGSHGPRALQRVVRYCDGWLPNCGRGGDLPAQIAELRRCAEQAGRDPKSISITAFAAPADPRAIEQFEAVGVERSVFFLPPEGADKVMPVLDRFAKLI
ncbi:MAG TPA: LLM class F420-dependent oxidoreductase [Candidatus Binataceae bacterium]|nr:LLM class F420-dependent oxidoreductase [Candidatus Binataceae bacterium]